jgi:uncharacterized protein (DUF1697 family)
LFWKRAKRGTSLTREERIIAWLGAISFLVVAIFEGLNYFHIGPELLILYSSYIAIGFMVFCGLLLLVLAGPKQKKKISQILARRYHENLERTLRDELESVATAEKLTFPRQIREDVISKLANTLSIDIMNTATPIEYSVRLVSDRVSADDVYLAGHILSIPFSEAQILANRMTDLSKNPQYRKKKTLLSLLSFLE